MDKIIGFIGAGNMAEAILGGIISANLVPKKQIIISNRSEGKLEKIKDLYGVNVTLDNKSVANEADILILAVKPHIYPLVIDEIKNEVKDHVVIINIAAGVTLEQTRELFNKELKIIKAMPNTPSLVKEGMSAITSNNQVTEVELQEVLDLFNSFGKAEVVDESLMDAVTAVSGSAPAYVYLFIEAMADAAVLEGMPRKQAYQFAAQTVLGAAKMVLETNEHPGVLKDKVCSPGGTTIEAVKTLEDKGLRSTVMAAMRSCSQKSKQMTNK